MGAFPAGVSFAVVNKLCQQVAERTGTSEQLRSSPGKIGETMRTAIRAANAVPIRERSEKLPSPCSPVVAGHGFRTPESRGQQQSQVQASNSLEMTQNGIALAHSERTRPQDAVRLPENSRPRRRSAVGLVEPTVDCSARFAVMANVARGPEA